MIMFFGHRIDLILILALVLILSGVVYGLTMLVLSRFEPGPLRQRHWRRTAVPNGMGTTGDEHSSPHVVFVLPCLNEGEVIGASIDRLTALDHPHLHILVVDDGSDDATAEVVRATTDPRVRLIQRVPPHARQGKGEALNAGIQHVRSTLVPGVDPAHVVVCIVDADGRLEPQALDEVLPLFTDPDLGAVQIGVRINNRRHNLLARMQDLEFVLYTEVFQRGRRHLGSVGLGGNGQFVRLAALDSLGPRPWTRSLAEDLDLGVRLLLRHWRTEFCSATSVHQQGLVDLRRWFKQRTRWFQGHLQSWPLVPWVLRDLHGTRRIDLMYHLTSPFLLLVGSLLSVAFGMWILGLGISLITGTLEFSRWWISAYLIACGPALLYGLIYRRREREHQQGPLAALVALHGYVLYATLWYVAGWRAAGRALLGRTGWTKTERTTEDLPADLPAGSPR